MENELAIAHEVQELLFPRDVIDLPTIGSSWCLPAGTHRQRRLL